jgi:hypothetical protein
VKVGDLVVCDCYSKTWYKGMPGLLIDFDRITKDPIVLYSGSFKVQLAKSSLKVINESRRFSKAK